MTDITKTTTTMNSNGRPDPTASTVKSKSTRPFAQAAKSYKRDFRDKSVLKAIAQLAKESDKNRYAKGKIPRFGAIGVREEERRVGKE